MLRPDGRPIRLKSAFTLHDDVRVLSKVVCARISGTLITAHFVLLQVKVDCSVFVARSEAGHRLGWLLFDRAPLEFGQLFHFFIGKESAHFERSVRNS